MKPSLAALTLLLACATAFPAEAQIDTLAIRAHTLYLSHDLLEGRGAATRGEAGSALYIEAQLRRLGLEGAAADGGYVQPVPLVRSVVDPGTSRVTVAGPGARRDTFATPRHFVAGTGAPESFRDFAGPAVLVGDAGAALAGIADAEWLRGRVAVVLGTLGLAALRVVPAWEEAGVAGVVFLVPDTQQYGLLRRSRGDDRLSLALPVDDPLWQPRLPSLVAGRELSQTLLEGVSLPSREPGEDFRPVPLGREIAARVAVRQERSGGLNVLGRIPGRHPELASEVVLLAAHHDHLGIGAPSAGGDSIYNGFSDNAAGVAMLLAVADALARDPPARSIVFAFFTAEERGLLGSTWFATSPPFPLSSIAGVVNLDAGAPPAPPATWRAAGGDASTLGDVVRRLAAAHGWAAEPGPAGPNSDHWPFHIRGVPAVFLIPGERWEGVDTGTREGLLRRWERYHLPDDHWSPEFPLEGLARYAELALEVARHLAETPDRPRRVPGTGSDGG